MIEGKIIDLAYGRTALADLILRGWRKYKSGSWTRL